MLQYDRKRRNAANLIKGQMRIFRTYMCDYGHHWDMQRRDGEKEEPSDCICPDGHPAITCRIELPVDDVQILISPAARIVDQVTRKRTHNGRYYLSLQDQTGKELCTSKEDYEWDVAVKLATFFKDKAVEQALDWWVKRNL